jgi:hypothetical protein
MGDSGQPANPANPGNSEPADASDATKRRATLIANFNKTRDTDTVGTCRMRLLALRTRVETNWPGASGGLFNRARGMDRKANADIASLLIALPTPLPLEVGGEPQTICRETDADMRVVAGRAVDAGLALLEGTTLETIYRGHVKMLEDYRPDAPEPIIVSNLTVGVLVATIIGTLDAISEILLDSADQGKGAKGNPARNSEASTQKSGGKPGRAKEAVQPHPAPPKRGPSVPRI